MAKTVGTILALKDQCTPAITKIAGMFKKTGETAEETNARVKKLNAQLRTQAKIIDDKLKSAIPAITGAVAGFAGATGLLINNSIKAGDRIDKMSQKMQMSRKTFQELEYVFSQNGANIEIMQGSMAKLSKSMDGARLGNKANILMFNRLGISLKDTKGRMKSTESVMLESISKLQKMREGARKSSLALELFGKSATELAPILNGNAKDVEELRKKFNDLGMGLSDEQINSAVKIGDTIDDIKRSFQGLANQVGADLLPTIQVLADKFISNIPKIKSQLTPVIIGFGKTIEFVCNNLDTIVPAIEGIIGAFGAMKLVANLGAIKAAFLAFTGPVGLVTAGIIALGAVIGVAYKKSEGFRNMVNGLGAVIKMLAVFTWNAIKTVGIFGAKIISGFAPVRYTIKWIQGLIKAFDLLIQKAGGWAEIGNKIKNWADKNTNRMLEAQKNNKPQQIETAVTSVNTTKNITENEQINKIKEVPAAIGPVKKHALGTTYSNGGVSLVGEYGPELVNLPNGASVVPAEKTKKILNQTQNTTIINNQDRNANRNIEVKLEVHGNIYGEEDFINKIINRFTLELNRVMV